jgi:hypothetical protein
LAAASHDLDTRIFLPSWWVAAFDKAALPAAETFGSIPQALASSIGPLFTTTELNTLASIISHIQGQLLSGAAEIVRVPAGRMALDSKGQSAAKVAATDSVISSLGGLRIFEQTGTEYSSVGLFKSERWFQGDSGWELELELSARGAELILGYSDPYFSLVETTSGRDLSGLMPKSALQPISLWKSVWLDLQGAEQWILLQLEKRMQWANEWLHLDGVFETNLEDLFQGLKLPQARDGGSEFARRLKLLERLGKKLVEHGFLTGAFEPRCLSFESHPTRSFYLGWHVARERLLGDEFWKYSVQAARYIAGRALASRGEPWMRIIGAGLTSSRQRQVAETIFPDLEKMIAEIAVLPMVIDGQKIITYSHLFTEWMLRQYVGNTQPLPADLRDSEAGRCASPKNKGLLVERFRDFVTEIAEHPSYVAALEQIPFATLVSNSTLGDPAFPEWLKKIQRSQSGIASLSERNDDAKPELIVSRSHVESELSAPDQNQRLGGPRTGEAAARVRKIARDELTRMRAHATAEYAALKEHYFTSLDDGERRLILDVQKRLKPNTFEDHLTSHLVKFMVDNPASWGAPSQNSQTRS